MTKKTTVKDLAHALNVSIGTIDRALHNRPGINEETKQKVLDKIKETGYETNRLAQSLSRKRRIKIGCIFPGRYQFFYPDMEAGINDAYRDLVDHNVQVIIEKTEKLGFGPEITFVHKLLEQGVEGLAICPGHRTQMNKTIDKLIDTGIPVVTIATDAPESKRLTCVSTDSFNNGQIAGDLMANFMNHRGKVAIMTGSHEVTDHQEKVRGFIDVIYSYPNAIEMVGVFETLDMEERVYQSVTQVIKDHPDLKGIYINTANSTYGCKALIDSGKTGQIYLIGTDLIQKNIPYIENGVMSAAIYQDPYNQGYKAIQILYDTITIGKKYGPNDYVKPDIVTQHNIKYFRCYS
jgi:LacI family transcriptional regulator